MIVHLLRWLKIFDFITFLGEVTTPLWNMLVVSHFNVDRHTIMSSINFNFFMCPSHKQLSIGTLIYPQTQCKSGQTWKETETANLINHTTYILIVDLMSIKQMTNELLNDYLHYKK